MMGKLFVFISYHIDNVKSSPETFFSPLYYLYNMFSMSNQQSPEIWPPTRSSHIRAVTDANARTPIANHVSTTNPTTITPLNMSVVPLSASLTSKKSKKIFRNGYEQSAPKPLSYTPYQPLTRWSGRKRHAFVLPDTPDLQPIKPHPGLNAFEWNQAAIAANLIPAHAHCGK
jgi:hypothetical protein